MLIIRFILIFTLVLSSVSYADSNLSETFNKHSAVMLLIDPSTGKIVKANSAACQFYGFSKSKLESLSIQDINLFSKDQIASEIALAKYEKRKHFIFRHKISNGDVKTVAVYSVPVVFNNENLQFSIIQDITAEREFKRELWHYQSNLERIVEQQVNQLDESKIQRIQILVFSVLFLATLVIVLIYLLKRKKLVEEQQTVLSQIVEQSSVSIETTDVNGVITYANQHFIDGTGFELSEVVGKKPSILKSGYHNVALYDDLWATITAGKHWVGEFYNKRKNGETFWERANIYPLRNTKNEISSYVAIKEDITQLKEGEKKLRLASTVFQTATEAVMINDANNLIVAVNDAFTLITGYSEAEVLGENPILLSSGHHDVNFYKEMNTELTSKGKWQGEICNRRKNGEVYYEWLSITALKNKAGELESYVSLFSDITKRKQAEDKIYHQANYDYLTGLANRNLFIDRFEQSIAVAKREDKSVALLFIDLDGFKNVNDTFGHSKGDLLLKYAAQRIESVVRTSDSVARLSGDEFAVMLCGDNDVYSNEKVAAKVLAELAAPFQLVEKEAHISASIGIAIFPDDGHFSEDLLANADSAMYKAKEKGKNNVQFFTKEMDIKAQQRRSLEVELRQAIKNNELVLHYQPIHDIKTGKVVSAEALIRWLHPQRGLIPPIEFIPLAEDIGFIVDIGDWVLEQACNQAQMWQTQWTFAPKISVNISSAQLHRADFFDKLKHVLTQSQLPPELLTLEMTESLLIEEDINTLAKLRTIRDFGIALSIDDFGTGYSSLSYLKRFPISILKIDRAFIKDITVNSEDEALTCAILSIAQSLNLKVVAEGVEEKAQCDLLAKHNCQFVQGYFFSKPIPAEVFAAYIDSH
ncbi:MAG: diguanylate cyclase (GGDEF)-like protein/PAS domain S-box-containing protein [Alteromonadaceae bacterium]|jgi:diguanylate cyclase (GGDEF)-like protein/PAS domain S-box-containing protein